MKELSLNILDVTKNSVSAGAQNILVSLNKDENGWLTLTIKDDGCGMSKETVENVTNPFYTTRTTRRVGLGLPLLKMAAEQTGGSLCITSSQTEDRHGTEVVAVFDTKSIDFMPVGDIVSTMCILISGSPEINFKFVDSTPDGKVVLDTTEIKAILGDGISLAEPEIQMWIGEYLKEQYDNR